MNKDKASFQEIIKEVNAAVDKGYREGYLLGLRQAELIVSALLRDTATKWQMEIPKGMDLL